MVHHNKIKQIMKIVRDGFQPSRFVFIIWGGLQSRPYGCLIQPKNDSKRTTHHHAEGVVPLPMLTHRDEKAVAPLQAL